MSTELVGDPKFNSDIGVILPTYGEAENIASLIEDIEDLPLSSSLLVIDDSSPDGTAEIVKNLQKKYNNILLYTRPQKSGLGSAITDGFNIFLSYKTPPKFIVTMDADYSHNPKTIPDLLSNMHPGCGIIIGSRYCKGGKITGWPLTRKIISQVANFIARISFNFNVQDCTSGFRCYSSSFLKETLGTLRSQTYEIQIETIQQALLKHFSVEEVPITFVNRKLGKSKLTLTEIRGFFSYVLKIAAHGITNPQLKIIS